MIEKLLERWFLLPLAPGAESVVAALVVAVAMICLRGRLRRDDRGQLRALPLIRITSGAVIAIWIVDVAVQTLWVRFPTMLWWSLALPLAITAAGVLAVAFSVPRRARRTGEPTLVGIRRTWLSFTDRLPLTLTGIAGALILVVTLICGAVSSPDEYGRYVFINFGDAGVATFYGWMFGVPVLIGLLLLITASLTALSRIATPPFSSPLAAQNETISRRTVSNAVVYLTGSVLALTLGGILKMIGGAGSGSVGVRIPGVGDFVWSPGYSSFAEFFTWSGWFLNVASFVMLIILVAGFVPFRSAKSGAGDATAAEARAQ